MMYVPTYVSHQMHLISESNVSPIDVERYLSAIGWQRQKGLTVRLDTCTDFYYN